MDLHAVKACGHRRRFGAARAKRRDDRFDLGIGEARGARNSPPAADGEGHLGRADDVLSTPGQPVAAHGLPPWVRQLQDELRIGALGHRGPPAQLLACRPSSITTLRGASSATPSTMTLPLINNPRRPESASAR